VWFDSELPESKTDIGESLSKLGSRLFSAGFFELKASEPAAHPTRQALL
jgi:hypothetical protein